MAGRNVAKRWALVLACSALFALGLFMVHAIRTEAEIGAGNRLPVLVSSPKNTALTSSPIAARTLVESEPPTEPVPLILTPLRLDVEGALINRNTVIAPGLADAADDVPPADGDQPRYLIRTVKPDPDTKYNILVHQPRRDANYAMRFVDPPGRPDLTQRVFDISVAGSGGVETIFEYQESSDSRHSYPELDLEYWFLGRPGARLGHQGDR